MKTAIVTGAAGFIGNMLIEKLLNCGVTVIALDMPGTASKFRLREDVSFIEADLQDFSQNLDDIPFNIDVLYHLAWHGVRANLRSDYHLQVCNLDISLNVMELACLKKVKKVIMMGSAAEYIGSGEPITGYNLPSPIEAYGAAKHAAFIICKTFAAQRGLDFIWTTVTSLYGPGRDDNNVLSYTIKTLLKSEKPSFTQLEQMWDYIYINDFINALYLIGAHGHAGKNYAVGSGKARPLKEYITAIRDSINPYLPLGIGEKSYKADRAEHSVFVIDELTKDTGFSPEYSFEEGIVKMIDYFNTISKDDL